VRSNPATSITETQAVLARKSAARSEFSSNLSATSDNEYSVNGPDNLIRELPFQGGFIALYRRYFNALVRRAPGIQLPIAIYIIGQTESAARRPEYATIPIKDLMMLTGAKERMNWQALAKLENSGLLKRDGRGGVKVCLESIDEVPLRSARTRKSKAKERKASCHAPSSIAALQLDSVERETVSEAQETERQLPECVAEKSVGPDSSGLSANDGSDRAVGDGNADSGESRNGGSKGGDCGGGSGRGIDGRAGQMDIRVAGTTVQSGEDGSADARVQLVAVKTETNCKKPETYCPWDWTCPHLSTTSELVSIKALKHNYSTTTAARAPAENPYLARFLEPHTRIAGELGIDDPAARRMWTESVAVNPALTPREFLLIVGMKLAEWRRVDDARPGRKIRSVVGSLIGSMPNAVQGALYLAAHEQAPLDLERDVYQARAILAGDDPAPRDRAWALGILSESQT
jgi:hypothetical protein